MCQPSEAASTLSGMDVGDLDPDPLRQFAAWYADAQAAGAPQPDATALATADVDGRPSVRMVLLKGFDERGFAFYTNRESRKARELRSNPRAALVFNWQLLHRQVRVEGDVERVSDEESQAYWATRPRPSQIAAWASPQSTVVAGRDELDRLYAETAARLGDRELPLPPFWGGYRLVPSAIEFWQGQENRFHDRIRYARSGAGWTRERLAP
jgi:pyridoxamine 5'-phosphate oxidase